MHDAYRCADCKVIRPICTPEIVCRAVHSCHTYNVTQPRRKRFFLIQTLGSGGRTHAGTMKSHLTTNWFLGSFELAIRSNKLVADCLNLTCMACDCMMCCGSSVHLIKVCFLVFRSIRWVGERLLTLWILANIWLLSRVSSYVDFEILQTREGFITSRILYMEDNNAHFNN